ncbi:MAG: RNA polymerase sigma factor [Erysipelotrichaceae bacterium]|nr:RNA polymerase sigma factor [Erysipelotrichaceae bacterium]
MMDKEKLYLEYFDQVYRFLLKMGADVNLAEELTAETMYRAINNISKFKAECKLSVWLCQIAKNLYLSKLKEDKRYTVLDDNIALNEEKTDTELSVKILQKVHELDEPYKEVFMLRVLSELSFKKIASLFKKNESWARVTYYRARMKIKEELKDEI